MHCPCMYTEIVENANKIQFLVTTPAPGDPMTLASEDTP